MILGVIFGVIYLIYKIGEDNTGGIVGFISGLFSLGYCAVIFAILAIGFSEENRIFGIYQGNIVLGAVGYAIILMTAGIIYWNKKATTKIDDEELFKKDFWIKLKAISKMWFWTIICGLVFQSFSADSIIATFLRNTFSSGSLKWFITVLNAIVMLGSPFITFGIYYVLRLAKKGLMKLFGIEDKSRGVIEDFMYGIEPTPEPTTGFPRKKDAKKKRRNQ